MYQDPSIGKIKVYYVVTKIVVMESTVKLVRNTRKEKELSLLKIL